MFGFTHRLTTLGKVCWLIAILLLVYRFFNPVLFRSIEMNLFHLAFIIGSWIFVNPKEEDKPKEVAKTDK